MLIFSKQLFKHDMGAKFYKQLPKYTDGTNWVDRADGKEVSDKDKAIVGTPYFCPYQYWCKEGD